MLRFIFLFLLLVQCPFLLAAQVLTPIRDGIFLSAFSAFKREPDILFNEELNISAATPLDNKLLQELLNSKNISDTLTIKDVWGISRYGRIFRYGHELVITGKIFLYYGSRPSTSYKFVRTEYGHAPAYIFALENSSKPLKLTRSKLAKLIKSDIELVKQLRNDDNDQETLILYVIEYNRRHDYPSEY